MTVPLVHQVLIQVLVQLRHDVVPILDVVVLQRIS